MLVPLYISFCCSLFFLSESISPFGGNSMGVYRLNEIVLIKEFFDSSKCNYCFGARVA